MLKRPSQAQVQQQVTGTAVAEAPRVAVAEHKRSGAAAVKMEIVQPVDRKQVRVKVRQYMTKPTEPGSSFDFQAKYNDNTPMPMRVMVGEVLAETKGMYRMKLYGRPEPSSYCLHCGRGLDHPVSILYGVGPICGQHYHINPLGSEDALKAAMEEIKAKLAAITWTGWIIKSAVEEWDEITEGGESA